VFEPAAQEAWSLFWRIFSEDKTRRMAAMSALGLGPMQTMALVTLEPGDAKPMRALAESMQCDNSSVTGIVDRLEAAGLVERRPSERDRRVKEVALTARGEQVRAQAQSALSIPPPPIAALSAADAAALRDILRRAVATMD
jgi:MarR family transcriptional regulator, organic hydroperoxide resistance regulator